MTTPEEILTALVGEFGQELGERIWLFLNTRLTGQRIYWARKAGRQRIERSVYERLAKGRSVKALAAAEGVSVRTIYRMSKRTLHRIRDKAA